MKMNEQVFVVGLNHRTAPVQLREKWSGHATKLPALVQHLRIRCRLTEVVVLSTCNRFEIYGTKPCSFVQPRHLIEAVGEIIELADPEKHVTAAETHLYHLEGGDCIRHLFRVASSLDSLVVGETEIVGQVKTAYQLAQASETTGPVLNRLFQTALSVSKQVRTRSKIGQWSTSVGAVAVDLAEKVFGETLDDRTILIVGAGKMGETTLRHLANRGAKTVLIANRSSSRADELASDFRGEAISLSDLPTALARADIVISSASSPRPLISKSDLATALSSRARRDLVLIDLAVPRNIDSAASELDGVYLYNIDQLAEIGRINLQSRQAEAEVCEQLVAEKAGHLAAKLASLGSPARREEVLGCFAGTFARETHEESIGSTLLPAAS